MIAYVILRPDGTVVDRSFSTGAPRAAWFYAESACGLSLDELEDFGYRLHSFEVPLPAPQAQETKP